MNWKLLRTNKTYQNKVDEYNTLKTENDGNLDTIKELEKKLSESELNGKNLTSQVETLTEDLGTTKKTLSITKGTKTKLENKVIKYETDNGILAEELDKYQTSSAEYKSNWEDAAGTLKSTSKSLQAKIKELSELKETYKISEKKLNNQVGTLRKDYRKLKLDTKQQIADMQAELDKIKPIQDALDKGAYVVEDPKTAKVIRDAMEFNAQAKGKVTDLLAKTNEIYQKNIAGNVKKASVSTSEFVGQVKPKVEGVADKTSKFYNEKVAPTVKDASKKAEDLYNDKIGPGLDQAGKKGKDLLDNQVAPAVKKGLKFINDNLKKLNDTIKKK